MKEENVGYVSAHSLSDLFFILRKVKSVEERKAIILHVCKFFKVISETRDFFVSICNNAGWNDLEDGLQMKCAEMEKLDYIVSRDKKKWLQGLSCESNKSSRFFGAEMTKPESMEKRRQIKQVVWPAKVL